jgi:hypothetical protein
MPYRLVAAILPILLAPVLLWAGDLPPIVINEINYNSSDDLNPDDWVEFHNSGESDIDMSNWIFMDEDPFPFYTFPTGTTLGAHGFLVVCRDTLLFASWHPEISNRLGNFGFGLSGGGELLRLYDSDGAVVDSLTYDDKAPWPSEANGHGATLVLTDPALDNALLDSWVASVMDGGTPGRPNTRQGLVVINEFMAENARTARDPQGQYDDWIELHNLGATPVDLNGVYLTDDLSQPLKWQFPDTALAAFGYLVVWADGDVGDTPGLHASFRLSADGEQIGLVDSDIRGNALLDSVSFGQQQSDTSVGRLPDGTGSFLALYPPTPGTENLPDGKRVDFDGDGIVGFPDFLMFAKAYNTPDPRYDLDGSGMVDFPDFLIFALSYGSPSRP